ncbi:HAD family hydrolase [Natrialba asiatica]|uniref:Haloacid dehalogenase n=1 Tax=Natrialba asiatica (strain ATCC 700177 / DSM 12278 / JCM 9576 / FERM P-10747 / NBRC 102637 / 172P1) TaxID=29540 RepID=M0ALH5_NATA1|nr:HAD family hydrolase [Natrialba asiatica]ELY98777.1 haloacid dehalogenase [Natrialba asiatica DSM 12278]
MAAYDAICFDLDRTLCEATQDPETVLASAFDRAGVDPFCTPDDLRDAIPALPTTGTAREFYEALFTEVVDRTVTDSGKGSAPGPGPGPDAAERLADSYLDIQDPTAVRFRPGAKAALERARELGHVGLITNGGRETQTQKLRALGIEDAFDVRVFTDPDAGIFPKPDAAPFEHALSALEATPETAIHVGDSLHADIGGANAMGLDSAWIDIDNRERTTQRGDRTTHAHRPTYELSSLETFETIL